MKTLPTVRKAFILSLLLFGLMTLILIVLTPYVTRVYPLGEDQGAAWYFWKLPRTSTVIRFSYWIGYLLHQISIIALLIAGRKDKPEKGRVGKYNLLVLGINLLFVLLHQIQTLLFYDGLAQDVPVFSSQGSVIIMLVVILFMMIPRRGLFFGIPMKTPKKMLRFINKWHGLYISWALIYTFWFHPMEGNWGMVSGFVYMFLLFIQLSLYNTKLHFNGAWIVLLEVFVAVHGALITVYKEVLNMMESSTDHIWAMFLYGFLVMFVFTQMYTFKWKKWLYAVVWGLFILSIVLVYHFVRGWNHIYEISFIPVALYGGTLLLLGIGKLIERGAKSPLPADGDSQRAV